MPIPIPKAPQAPIQPVRITDADLMWVDLEDFCSVDANFSSNYYFPEESGDKSLASLLAGVPKEISPENIFIRMEKPYDQYPSISSSEEEDYDQTQEKTTFKVYYKPNAHLTSAQISDINKKNEREFLKKQEAYRDALFRYENVEMVEYKIKVKEAEIAELKKKMEGFKK